jgi:branched-chain amino acid aminotransferase
MRKIKAWINGKFLDVGEAKISVFDRGFLYGDGLFETMRSYGGNIFKLAEHLSRLFYSSKVIKLKIPYSKRTLEGALYKILKVNRLDDAYIRLTLTRGDGPFTLKKDGRSRPNVVISAKEFRGYPQRFYSAGINAQISDIRQDERSPLSGIKTLNFLGHILARMRTQEDGFNEAIITNTEGRIAEAATGNIFLVKRRLLLTPSLDSGILPGITRGVVIRIAKGLKIRVSEKPISAGGLISADEVFLTNSLAEILPVVKIGRAEIGKGRPGEITKLLHASYRKMV